MNLDTLKTEIPQYLEESGLAVFHGHPQAAESTPAVYWDCEQYPDYKLFIQTAQAAGVKIVVFHQHRFDSEQVDDALEQLAECEFSGEEQREYKRRLTAMRIHDGQTCSIELSFDYQGRVFIFDLRTEWYDELSDLLQEIELISGAPDEDDSSFDGGYFSKN
ncbi:MAG TPA: hypothetical protein VGV35_21225 [Bryobacteraceae bacterium]|nr:hypothetical protein [Bryobacteraceae bacterium]